MASALDYITIDPFGAQTSGVTNYVRTSAAVLGQRVRLCVISTEPQESRARFRRRVARLVGRFDPNRTIVEAPETRAATLLVPEHYRTHVRLHCPRAVGQTYEGELVDPIALAEERRAVAKAAVVSAPSFAVVRAAARFMSLDSVAIFPNPIVLGTRPEAAKDIDVLYIGRFQALKGVGFLPAIIAHLPAELRVCLAGPGAAAFTAAFRLGDRVTVRGEVSEEERGALLARSRVVIIPSLFESFSMVIAEALAAGVPVVSWQSGAAPELAPFPLIRCVPPWRTDRFAAEIVAALAEPVRPDAFTARIEALNHRYTEAMEAFLQQGGFPADAVQAAARLTDNGSNRLPNVPKHVQAEEMRQKMTAVTPPWRRKLRKLRRDPAAYFRDAKVVKAVRMMMARSARGSVPDSAAASAKAAGSDAPIVSVRVRDQAEIIVTDVQPASSTWSTLVLLRAQERAPWEAETFRMMSGQVDFVGFRSRYLHFGHYDDEGSGPEASLTRLLDRIGPAGKDRLGRFRNLVFFNPTSSLPYALRAATPGIRLMIVVTPEGRDAPLNLPESEIDVLIAPDGLAIPTQRYRRHFLYKSANDIVRLLRQAVIEAAERPRNVLLPMVGGQEHDPSLIEIDTRRVHGVIRLSGVPSNVEPRRCRPFSVWMEAFAPRIAELYFSEELYLRYRSLCDRASTAEDWARIVQISLADGALYDVRS